MTLSPRAIRVLGEAMALLRASYGRSLLSKRLAVRVTEEEAAGVWALAEAAGYSPSELLRCGIHDLAGRLAAVEGESPKPADHRGEIARRLGADL